MGRLQKLGQILKDDRFKSFFDGAAAVATGLNKIAGFVAFIHPSSTLASLTVATSANLVSGLGQVLGALSGEEEIDELCIGERFNAIYAILCHQAYLDAVREVLAADSVLPDLDKTEDSLPSLLEAQADFPYTSLKRDPRPNQLFDRLDQSLRTYASLALELEDLDGTCKKVMTNALDKLNLAIAEPGKGDWVHNWQQNLRLSGIEQALGNLHMLNETCNATSEIKSMILEIWGERKDSSTTGNQNLIASYKAQLLELTQTPIFNNGVGTAHGIEDLFVQPDFTFEVPEQGKKSPPTNLNLAALITHRIGYADHHRGPVYLMGNPGSGKTSFVKVLAASLAQLPDVLPLYIELKKINPQAPILADELVNYLVNGTLEEAARELPGLECQLVFLLDGFDELERATQISMKQFFEKVRDLQQVGGRFCDAFFLLSGRPTLFDDGDLHRMKGDDIYTLLPFDKPRVTQWSVNWNKIHEVTEGGFDGTRYLKETNSYQTDGLDEMVRQPLLLNLMALLHLANEAVPLDQKGINRVQVYENIMEFFCIRHRGKRARQLNEYELRQLLQVVGFCTHTSERLYVHRKKLARQIKAEELGFDMDFSDGEFAEQTILTFNFVNKENGYWEFLHKSFGEFLAGEFFLSKLKEIADPSRKLREKALIWVDIFSPSFLTKDVENFLRPMLERWHLDGPEETGHLLKGIEEMYMRFYQCEVDDLSRLANIEKYYHLDMAQAHANLLANMLLLGSLTARLQGVYLHPEQLSQDSWWSTYNLLERWFEVESLASRFFKGIALDNLATQGKARGKCFNHLRITSFRDDGPINISRACFIGTNLEGVTFPVLTNNWQEHELQGANMTLANLTNVDFGKASLRRVNFNKAEIRDADFGQAELELCDFTDVDISKGRRLPKDLMNRSCKH